MKECVRLRPEVGAQIQFLEWTGAEHLRPTKFVALRAEKEECGSQFMTAFQKLPLLRRV